MSDERNFQKRLAKLQIQATIVAVLLSAIIALGAILLSLSMTVEVKELSNLYANIGIAIILISLVSSVGILVWYYRDVERIDKGRRYYT
jgi:hypothetical protein